MKVMVLLDKLLNYQWNNYGNDNKHMYSDQNFNLTLQQ